MPATRLLAAALAAGALAASTVTVIAGADVGGKAGRHQHPPSIATPRHAAPAARSHAKVGSAERGPEMAAALGVPETGPPVTDEPGLGAATPSPTPGGQVAPPAARTLVATAMMHRALAARAATAAPPALPATGGPAAPAPHSSAVEVPDIVLIPPPPLPAPAVIKPAAAGFSAGPLIGLVLGLVLLGGLLGLRLARRPG